MHCGILGNRWRNVVTVSEEERVNIHPRTKLLSSTLKTPEPLVTFGTIEHATTVASTHSPIPNYYVFPSLNDCHISLALTLLGPEILVSCLAMAKWGVRKESGTNNPLFCAKLTITNRSSPSHKWETQECTKRRPSKNKGCFHHSAWD